MFACHIFAFFRVPEHILQLFQPLGPDTGAGICNAHQEIGSRGNNTDGNLNEIS